MNTLASIFSPQRTGADTRVNAVQPLSTKTASASPGRETPPRRDPPGLATILSSPKTIMSARKPQSSTTDKSSDRPVAVAADPATTEKAQKPASEVAATSEQHPDATSDTKDDDPQPSPAAEDVAADDSGYFEIRRFIRHRWVGDSIQIEVEWERGAPGWEPEEALQRDAPRTLYAYWRAQGGRPPNPNDPELYEVFDVLKHSKDRKRLLIQWTGYGPKDATWEAREPIAQTAPEVVDKYFAQLKEKSPARKGRPRKRR